MPLIGLIGPIETAADFLRWSFEHARDHDEIDQAMQGLNLSVPPSTPLDPFPPLEAAGEWLLRHQVKHFAMNGTLGISGADLTQYDLTKPDDILALVAANYAEHQAAHQLLTLQGAHGL